MKKISFKRTYEEYVFIGDALAIYLDKLEDWHKNGSPLNGGKPSQETISRVRKLHSDIWHLAEAVQ